MRTICTSEALPMHPNALASHTSHPHPHTAIPLPQVAILPCHILPFLAAFAAHNPKCQVADPGEAASILACGGAHASYTIKKRQKRQCSPHRSTLPLPFLLLRRPPLPSFLRVASRLSPPSARRVLRVLRGSIPYPPLPRRCAACHNATHHHRWSPWSRRPRLAPCPRRAARAPSPTEGM